MPRIRTPEPRLPKQSVPELTATPRGWPTEVNIFDGATVVMGGLTREEVKEVRDKVPILGDIPLLGRLFSSKGSTTQKRNLLIFVTAHTITPDGSKRILPISSEHKKTRETLPYK